MRAAPARNRSGDGRTWTVAAIVAPQSLAAAFFVVDALADLQLGRGCWC